MLKLKSMLCCLAAASLMLSGCTTTGSGGGSAPPGTTAVDVVAQIALTQTKVGSAISAVRSAAGSNTAVAIIRDAWDTFDVALSGIDVLVQTGRLKKNSPAALQVRSAVAKVKHGLQAATAAQQAGSASSASAALAEAQTALAQIRAALQ